MFAFEHDTFLSIRDNAQAPENRIRTVLGKTRRLLLIGHSRGGLVARYAAMRLRETKTYDGELFVWTYGTPHQGTPIATVGAAALQQIATISNPVNGVIGCVDSGLAAINQFMPMLTKAPPGISQMIPDCEFLQILGERDAPASYVTAHAGEYDIDRDGTGFGMAFRGSFGRTAFDGRANDLVVPTASASGCGPNPRTIVKCAHSSYFANRSVQEDIAHW